MSEETADYETILVEDAGNVRSITLNRPEKANAISGQMREELIGACEAAASGGLINAIILKGAGNGFSGGYDLTGRGKGEHDPMADLANLTKIRNDWARLRACPLPVIAQVHGYCIAGGTDLSLLCDIVVVATDARVGFPPVRSMGVPPGHWWIYHVHPQWAKRLLLTGDSITGAKAAEIGFALAAVPPEELHGYVTQLAERIALAGRNLVMLNKRLINQGMELMGASHLQELATLLDCLAHVTPEAAEFRATAGSEGLAAAFNQRDSPFEPEG